MLLLLVASASTAGAAGLPWECPAFSTPEEASVYRDTDGGLTDTWVALDAEARTWWDESCAWVETTTDLGAEGSGSEGTRAERTCTTAAGATLSEVATDTSGTDFPGWTWNADSSTVTVVPPAGGATWSEMTLAYVHGSSSAGHDDSGGSTRSATWTGDVLGLPTSGSFEVVAYSTSGSSYDRGVRVTTPACAWTWDYADGDGRETVTTGGHTVTAYNYLLVCRETPKQAWIDGVLVGAVDWTTWALDEGDRDGWSVADGDCDDTDPTVYPCADEIPLDGIDQDCDGGDSLDGDGDGVDAAFAGGADCDDSRADVYPGAHDTPMDGVDGDCDGADDVDADGDGFTADGDDQAADCDDSVATVYPGAPERAYDGVDQDCDSLDLTDNDHDGFDATEVGGDDCDDGSNRIYPGAMETSCDGEDGNCDGLDPCDSGTGEPPSEAAEDTTGCATTSAPAGLWALLLPALLLRRRSQSGDKPT